MKPSGAQLLASIAWLSSACGTAAPYDYELPVETPPPLVTMQAQISGSTEAARDAAAERILAAFVWLPVSPEKGKVQISQNASTRRGLINHRIDLSQQPPERAIERGGDGSMRYGQAELIVYEDRNNNGELDLRPFGRESPDRVLGRANDVRLWWLGAGSPAPVELRGYRPVAPGFSITYGPVTSDPRPGECGPDPEPKFEPRCNKIARGKAVEVLPQDAVEILLSDDDSLKRYTCQGFWGTSAEKSFEWPDHTPGWNSPQLKKQICDGPGCECNRAERAQAGARPIAKTYCPLDLPAPGQTLIAPIQCNEARTAYVWKACVDDPELCNTTFCHFGHGELDLNAPMPEDWPCPWPTVVRSGPDDVGRESAR